jgi:alginate O-acetyltransferase complex protein AlgJ
MKTASESAMSAFVHEGQDGWLFLRGGTNFVASLYSRDSGNLPDARIALWRQLIERRTARCRALGIACLHVVVPDKLTIYGDRQATPLVDPEHAPAIRLAQQLQSSPAADSYLDLVGPMRAQRESCDLYWRTDTHWSPEGCHLAYSALCERLRLVPEDGLLDRPHQTLSAPMDLGGRVEPMRWETVRRYNFAQKSSRVWTNRVAQFLEDPAYQEEIHIGARSRFLNPTARNEKTALLVGDSYSRPGLDSLTGMLAETVRSLEFVWSSEIDWFLVKRTRPDILIVEIAERFLAMLPRDNRSLWLLELRQIARAHRRRRENARAAGTNAS